MFFRVFLQDESEKHLRKMRSIKLSSRQDINYASKEQALRSLFFLLFADRHLS